MSIPSSAQLRSWMSLLAILSPRFTGDWLHRLTVKAIAWTLHQIAADTGTPIAVQQPKQSFDRWLEQDHSLSVVAGNAPAAVPLIGYYPYAGSGLVTADLVELGSGFSAAAHAGKIVLVKVRPPNMSWLLWALNLFRFRYPWYWLLPLVYRRAVFLEEDVDLGVVLLSRGLPRWMAEAAQAGAVGLVFEWDLPPAVALGQYLPFTHTQLAPLPAVFVDRVEGAALRSSIQLAGGSLPASLEVKAQLTPAAITRHVVATLPAQVGGAPVQNPEVLLVVTHTDGPNAPEDNGILALLVLVDHFARQPDRPKELVFLFASAHFTGLAGSTDHFVAHFPATIARTSAALVLEHLGARRWTGGAIAGREPALVWVSKNRDLYRLVKKQVKKHKLKKTALLRSHLGSRHLFFGEGRFLDAAGKPTVGVLPNPHYLCSHGAPHDDKVDTDEMRRWLEFSVDLIEGLM